MGCGGGGACVGEGDRTLRGASATISVVSASSGTTDGGDDDSGLPPPPPRGVSEPPRGLPEPPRRSGTARSGGCVRTGGGPWKDCGASLLAERGCASDRMLAGAVAYELRDSGPCGCERRLASDGGGMRLPIDSGVWGLPPVRPESGLRGEELRSS